MITLYRFSDGNEIVWELTDDCGYFVSAGSVGNDSVWFSYIAI